MGCRELLRGHDVRCFLPIRKYFQQIVLINIEDVNEVFYDVNEDSHSILFNLFSAKTGYKFIGNDAASLYSAGFSKSEKKGMPVYNHNIELPVIGVDVRSKVILKELDLSNYFAAIQFRDGTIEIYGFENGLKTVDYTYETQNGLGGASINLTSKYPEIDPPYVYLGDKQHFNDNFAGIGQLRGGDFNNDFNNDFFILQV